MNRKLTLSVTMLMLLMSCACVALGQTALEKVITEAVSDIADAMKKADGVDQIAIITLENDQDNEVTDRLITAVVNGGKFKVIDRQSLEILFQEQDFQMSDIIDPGTAKKAGMIAGVDAVMYGSIKRQEVSANDAQIAMHVQMVKVQDAHIVFARDFPSATLTVTPPRSIDTWQILVIIGAVVLAILIAIAIFALRPGRDKTQAISPAVMKSPESVPPAKPGEHQTVNDIADLISVEQPHSVKCELKRWKRKASIGRMQLKLAGEKKIPGGWTGKIAITSGIDRRHTLKDGIPLPEIQPNAPVAVGPFDVDIPRDVKRSRDKWALEFCIVDPYKGEAIIFRG